jgi:hypothetical protein
MGFDINGLEAVLLSLKYCKDKSNCLTLGRQGIHISKNTIDNISSKFGIKFSNNIMSTNYSENLFSELGFNNIESIDYSNYENASIIHDFNKPIPSYLKDKYDYIFDGGCTEHIFNIAQVSQNIIDMLKVNGIYVSVTCNNNFSGHGMYQFSPEYFMSTYSTKYGMEILELYLTNVNNSFDKWINVKQLEGTNGRNITKINNTSETYIISIARKISNNYLSLFDNPPQQYSYSTYDWK